MDLTERSGDETQARHPWEEARATFFLDLLERHHAVGAASRVLDVGAGDAYFARRLLERFPGAEVFAWDSGYSDDEARALAGPGIVATRTRPHGSFDLVLLLDVIEHLDDEGPFLEDLRRTLAPGARVLVSVPAWQQLHGSHDMRLRHRRRYDPRAARALLEQRGFVIVEHGGLFHSLLVPRSLSVAVEARLGRTASGGLGSSPTGPLRKAMSAVLRVDNALSAAFSRAGLDVPGLSWWALCARGAP